VIRKVKEIILAYRIEKLYSKDEILNLYLNQIPFGQNSYGIEAASQTYFAKHASELSLSEAALLAAAAKGPSYFSPWGSHLAELEGRRQYVLEQMEGVGFIDKQQLEDARENKPQVLAEPQKANFNIAPHFVIYVQDYLNQKYGEDSVRRSGMRVVTTLDVDLQKLANQKIADGGERNIELNNGHNAAMVAEDATNGQILAMVGSRDYFADSEPSGCIEGETCLFEGKFNVSAQGLRQPGSALKPFVYSLAFKGGLTPDTVLFDVPTEFSANNPDCPAIPNLLDENKKCYHPQNYDRLFRGPVMLKDALAQSLNLPAVKVLHLVGLQNAINWLGSFGLTTLDDPERIGLSLILGGGEIRLTELTNAYATLANDGVFNPQTAILSIEDSKGNILEQFESKSERVVDEQYARLINDILSDPKLREPLFGSGLPLTQIPGKQIAIKTGTAENYVDAWTFGYSPRLVIGVWAGNSNRYPLGKAGSSILAAIPIWHSFAAEAFKNEPSLTFIKPEPIYTESPILLGAIDKNNIHDILYFLNRVSDSQYQNWEESTKTWVATNGMPFYWGQPTYTFKNDGSVQLNGGKNISIDLSSPKNGDFINSSSEIKATIYAESGIKNIELYLNNELIDNRSGELGNKNNYSFIFGASILKPQNSLILRAINKLDNSTEEEIIVFN
jgi:membrane peptidoglycan carboxypeptidase